VTKRAKALVGGGVVTGHGGPDLARGGDERRGLLGDETLVVGLGEGEVALLLHLEELAEGHAVGGAAQDLDRLPLLARHHLPERLGVDVVAEDHRHAVVPERVDRG